MIKKNLHLNDILSISLRFDVIRHVCLDHSHHIKLLNLIYYTEYSDQTQGFKINFKITVIELVNSKNNMRLAVSEAP